jgi:hypothetical protein
MNKKILDRFEVVLTGQGDPLTVYVDVYDNSLSRKWLDALNTLVQQEYHLEKNYCFFGFVEHQRNGAYILEQVNKSILAINSANIGYTIDDHFTMENCITDDQIEHHIYGRNLIHSRLNLLHRYFEELQGVSGNMSEFYNRADDVTRWHIRQLNLLCHEFESWALSYRKQVEAPEWTRPSQLMCWINAPRFTLDEQDYELFGVETINRPLGGVYVGVNKAIGKHHWEVFNDEGRDSRIGELVTGTLRTQTEAAGDFDIEWANNPGNYIWQQRKLEEFKEWLIANNFDPQDKSLTIGHPQVGQVDLMGSFGTEDYKEIWAQLSVRLNVRSIKTSKAHVTYEYDWSDPDYMQLQVAALTNKP